jgi:putative RNA 2'-phosphotransferase
MNEKELDKKSRVLVTALRHSPALLKIELDDKGWTSVESILLNLQVTKEELDWIVETNNKKRFEYNDNQSLIRASQGHTVDVNLEKDWKEYVPEGPLYHGTSEDVVLHIMKDGLISMKRTHVHLSKDLETAIKVGSRKGKVAILEIDARKLRADGQKLYESANGVILTSNIASCYIKFYKP